MTTVPLGKNLPRGKNNFSLGKIQFYASLEEQKDKTPLIRDETTWKNGQKSIFRPKKFIP